MKLLKIERNCGFYMKDGSYCPIDKITKEELLVLVNLTLNGEEFELEQYDENLIKNKAHQIIYKSIARKLLSLRERRQEFIDESARLYLDEYEKYREVTSDSIST